MIEIDKKYNAVDVTDISISRNSDAYDVIFSFKSDDSAFEAKLIGVRDVDSVCELFEAERIWFKKEENNQLQYGSFTLGVSGETYTEIMFDELA